MNLIANFEDFDIISVPQALNTEANLLSNVASILIPSTDFSLDKFLVEFIFRPLVLDNITNWRVFYDDGQIINFIRQEGVSTRSHLWIAAEVSLIPISVWWLLV
jgi:hypothetical protein